MSESAVVKEKAMFGILDIALAAGAISFIAYWFFFRNKGKKEEPPSGLKVMKGFSADSLARWISERVGIQKFKIVTPPDYQLMFTVAAVALVVIITVTTQYNRLSMLLGRTQWACIILLIALLLMSGHMWNSIRHPPFYGRDRSGQTSYLAPGSGNQYGVETYVIMSIYGAATFGMVLLNDGTRYFKNKKFRQASAVIGLAIYFIFVNLLLGVFSSKYHGYPYNYIFTL